jgi:hypothetical protein
VYVPPPPRTRWYAGAQAAGAVAVAVGVSMGPVLALMTVLAADASGDATGRAERAVGWCGRGMLGAGAAFVLGLLLLCGTTRTRRATLWLAVAAGAAAGATLLSGVAAYAAGAG